jgi:ribosomal protein L11 methyltransferase
MDIDDIAVKVARENIALNELEDVIHIQQGNIVEVMDNMEADAVLANITAEVVEMLLPRAAEILPVGGLFFGSGIVDSRWPGVKKQLEKCGFVIDRVLTDTDWVGVAAIKSK